MLRAGEEDRQDDPFAPPPAARPAPDRPDGPETRSAPVRGAARDGPSDASWTAPALPARGHPPSLDDFRPDEAEAEPDFLSPPSASTDPFEDPPSGSGRAPLPAAPPRTAELARDDPAPGGAPGSATRLPPGPLQAAASSAREADATPPPPRPEEALDALFEGLGLDVSELSPRARAAMAAELGRSFRALADGMRRLLEGRRTVKRELGVAGTQVELGANPLKFAPDAQAAVDGLLRPLTSGYLSGPEAVEDAVASMQAHQLALVGAIRSAIRISLEAFDPAELERKLARRGLSHMVPALRKAELWERFTEDYQRFARQADDDIRMVIGRELDRLYAGDAAQARRDSGASG